MCSRFSFIKIKLNRAKKKKLKKLDSPLKGFDSITLNILL